MNTTEQKVHGFARSKDGSIVHKIDCPHARVSWNWADGMTDWEVIGAVLARRWLRLCKKCFR